jgi:hypothetical protein
MKSVSVRKEGYLVTRNYVIHKRIYVVIYGSQITGFNLAGI